MAGFEEQLEQMEGVLARISQTQAQGQAQMETAIQRVEGLIPAAGAAVAEALQTSAGQAAEAHREALLRAVDEVTTASRGAVADASTAIQEIRQAFQAEVQASQRMVTSEQKVEAALDALLPKVASVRGNLEQELGEAVKATAETEADIKRMVTAIRSSMTKEIEGEIRTKLHEAADHAVERIHGLGAWWDHFTRIGIHVAMAFSMVATGLLGWWFGRHQIEVGTYEKAVVAVQKNAMVLAYAYQFNPDTEGKYEAKRIILEAPLAWTAPGKFTSMTKNERGQWVYGKVVAESATLLSAAVWDTANTEPKLVKENRP